MNVVRIILDVDKEAALENVPRDKVVILPEAEVITFSRIPSGMTSGASAVGITFPLADGRYLFAQLSMNNFEGIAAAFRGAEQREELYQDPKVN